MTLHTEIRQLPGGDKFELVLPSEATGILGLETKDGRAMPIRHENKMQLEWLARTIVEKFDLLSGANEKLRARLKVRRKWAMIVLGVCVVLGVTGGWIAEKLHFDKLYILTAAFTIGVVSCLQLLKYLAMGFAAKEPDPEMHAELEALREQIVQHYSE